MTRIIDIQFVRELLAYSVSMRPHWGFANAFISNNFTIRESIKDMII
jgi:hypothetical protein